MKHSRTRYIQCAMYSHYSHYSIQCIVYTVVTVMMHTNGSMIQSLVSWLCVWIDYYVFYPSSVPHTHSIFE